MDANRSIDPLTERSARVVSYAKLHRGAARRKAGLFVAEGYNSVEAALVTGRATVLLATEDAAERHREVIQRAIDTDVEVQEITPRAADKLSESVTPPGLFAVCRLLDTSLDDVLARSPRLLAVPVECSEPGNVGTLIRTAAAMGADAVVLAGEGVDPHNGKSVRASAGSIFHIPVVRAGDPFDLLERLQSNGIATCATAGGGELSLPEANSVLGGSVAWLFGNEAHGLPDDLLARADHRISIPIHDGAESLNLAAAAAICLYVSSRAHAD